MKQKQRKQPRRPVVETIEPRILYSADLAPGLAPDSGFTPEVEQRTVDTSGEFAQTGVQEAMINRFRIIFVL